MNKKKLVNVLETVKYFNIELIGSAIAFGIIGVVMWFSFGSFGTELGVHLFKYFSKLTAYTALGVWYGTWGFLTLGLAYRLFEDLVDMNRHYRKLPR